MIPIGDKLFLLTNKKPFVVWFLIGINIALFLWQIKLELSGELGTFVNNWGLVPEQISTAFGSAISGNPAAGLIYFGVCYQYFQQCLFMVAIARL